ncbi:MAG: RNA polymerase sigma factor SigJ [Jatrophihabitans sp.]
MTDPFATHRRLLFKVAYDLLGSVADAEDVVQDTWLRWSATDRFDIRDARAYLVRIVTTQALNRLRAIAAKRETYVGPWLPEPLVEPDDVDVVGDAAVREHDVSIAMLVVLETLSPPERAVFVLREVFGMSHDEIAAALDRTPASVRQLAHRARGHVQARRPRFEADETRQRQATQQFLLACATGDLSTLLGLLAPDVRLISDGGGHAKAARRPIEGADKVGRFMIGIAGESAALDLRFALINGTVGVVGYDGDVANTVALLDLDLDGRVTTVFIVANPEKLAHLRR